MKTVGKPARLRTALRSLYFGNNERARRFRYGLVAFDVVTIAIFIVAASVPGRWWRFCRKFCFEPERGPVKTVFRRRWPRIVLSASEPD